MADMGCEGHSLTEETTWLKNPVAGVAVGAKKNKLSKSEDIGSL